MYLLPIKFHTFSNNFYQHHSPGGGGVLKEFLGGDVPLGPWNP